jgi:hypothetical protein
MSASDLPLKITELWAWVWVDPDGREHIVGYDHPVYGSQPLLFYDRHAAESHRWTAQRWADMRNALVKLVRFASAEISETLSSAGAVH